MRGPSSTDPIIRLPVELVYIVFNDIPFKDLLSCVLVSKSWNFVLTNQPCIWINHIDVRTHANKSIPFESYMKYLSLGINDNEDVKSITEINLDLCSNNIIYTYKSGSISKQNRILANQPSLLQQPLLDTYVPRAAINLRKISINIPLIEYSVFMDVLERSPLLESVCVSDFRFVGRVPKVPITDSSNIRKLVLQRIKCDINKEEDEFVSSVLKRLNNVEDLEISLIHSEDGLIEVISNMTKLKTLLLRYLYQSRATLPFLNLPSLEVLTIRAWSLILPRLSPPPLTLKTIDIICDSYASGTSFTTLLELYSCWRTIVSMQLVSNKFWNKQELKLICQFTPNLQQITLPCRDVELDNVLEIASMTNLYKVNVNPRYRIIDNQLGYYEYRKDNWIQKNILNNSVVFERA